MKIKCKFCGSVFQKNYNLQKFCSVSCANKYNLNHKNQVKLPRINKNLAELFGILLGDGSVTQYYAKIYLNRIADIEYVPFIKKLCTKLFPGASVTCRNRINLGTVEIQISSKDVCDYLRKIGFNAKERKIPAWIIANKQFLKFTIRGLFDTEGSVGIKYFKGKTGNYLYKQLTVTNKNKNILGFLEKYLSKFGYKPTKNLRNNIYISNKKDILGYLSDIGSSNPKIIFKIKIKEINGFVWRVAPNGKAAVLKTAASQGA